MSGLMTEREFVEKITDREFLSRNTTAHMKTTGELALDLAKEAGAKFKPEGIAERIVQEWADLPNKEEALDEGRLLAIVRKHLPTVKQIVGAVAGREEFGETTFFQDVQLVCRAVGLPEGEQIDEMVASGAARACHLGYVAGSVIRAAAAAAEEISQNVPPEEVFIEDIIARFIAPKGDTWTEDVIERLRTACRRAGLRSRGGHGN